MLVIYNLAFKAIFMSSHHSDTIVSQLCSRTCLVSFAVCFSRQPYSIGYKVANFAKK